MGEPDDLTDDLRVAFYSAATLCEDILDRICFSSSMGLEEYNDCKNHLKLANETYPSVSSALSALSDLQKPWNKGTLDSTELDAMKTTKKDLITRFSANWSDLDQWVSNNPIATTPFNQQTPAYSSDTE